LSHYGEIQVHTFIWKVINYYGTAATTTTTTKHKPNIYSPDEAGTPNTESIIIEVFLVLNVPCKPDNEVPATNPHIRIGRSNYELSSSSMAYYL
jgi:hypothetical protein